MRSRRNDAADTRDDLREAVRGRYAEAARAAAPVATEPATDTTASAGCCAPTDPTAATSTTVLPEEEAGRFGAGLYDASQLVDLPEVAVTASLGCGVPTEVADLQPGETVLDLGSGAGIDVLIAARRVGPDGTAYGLDMTPEMLELARANAVRAGADNAVFLEGTIEAVPLPDASVDVAISNCVINLSTDKPAVLRELARVVRPGGRLAISDVVAEDRLTPAERAERGSFVGCIAGALSFTEYRDGLSAVGFLDIEVATTHEVADGMHAAVVRAVRQG